MPRCVLPIGLLPVSGKYPSDIEVVDGFPSQDEEQPVMCI